MNTSVLSSPQVAQSGGGGDVGERLSHLQMQQENDTLKAQVRDLTEKLDTLKGLLLFFYFLFGLIVKLFSLSCFLFFFSL